VRHFLFAKPSDRLVQTLKIEYNRNSMKASGHPTYNDQAQVICVCGNRFTVGSTQDTIHVELCYKCHPFYTGEQKFVDSASRIQKFQAKQKVAQEYKVTAKKKVDDKKKADNEPKTLREMLIGAK